MVKKLHIISLILVALLCATSASAGERKVVKITTAATSADSGEGHDYYVYDAQGKLLWLQSTTNSSRDVYEYNAEGQKVKKTTYSWIPADKAYKLLNEETYTYEGEKLVRMDQKLNVGSTFERNYYNLYLVYDDGNSGWSQYNAASDALRYQYKEVYEKNASGKVTKKTVMEFDPDYPEDGWYLYETSEYEFAENGDIKSETYKTFKSDGSVKKTIERTYTFGDLESSYVPANVKTTSGASSITLTWNAVAGASSYAVTYDLEHKIVEGTSFTAEGINEGEHEFVVQAIIDGAERNACTPISASVIDPGQLPAENLQVGECRKVYEPNEDTGEDVTFYYVPLSWTLPAGHSEIKGIRIYRTDANGEGESSYTPLEDFTATSCELKLFEYQTLHIDEAGNYTDGITFNITVVLVYGSGEADPSNVVTINVYNQANGIGNAITNVPSSAKSTEAYNLAGQRVAAKEKGIVIVNGKKMLLK